MPEKLVFSQPALLAGIGAAALPVLIHLLLRPRPRRMRFPALALMRGVVVSGQRASRLRNLALLALRVSLLALIATLLAGPAWTPGEGEFAGHEPLACVIVLDDSASMHYRATDDRTWLEWARSAALEFVEQSAGWPPHSALAVVSARLEAPPAAVSEDRAAAVAAIRALPAGLDHARPLGAALRAGAELLRAAPQRHKRMVVFTDGCAHAWRDVTPAILAGIDDLYLRVITPPDEPVSNLAISDASGPARLHPASAPIPIQATLSAEGRDAECWLIARQAGQTLARVGPLRVTAGSSLQVDLELPPLGAGAQAITLEIEPPDRLTFDQVRHAAFQTGPPPRVWLVTPAGRRVDQDLSATILMNLLAPTALPAEQQLVDLECCTPADVAERLTTFPADGTTAATGLRPTVDQYAPALVVVLSGVAFTAAELGGLLRLMERGTTVLLVPGSELREHDWPGLRTLLAPRAPGLDALDDPSLIRWQPDSPFDGEEGLAELTRCAVRRRLRLSDLAAPTTVHARYSDELPAIVGQQRGAGRLLLLTTAPDPDWSDLGIRAAGLLTWLHLLVQQQQPAADAAASFALGTQTYHTFGGLPDSGLVRVTLELAREPKSWWVRMADGKPDRPWPTEQAGIYGIGSAGAETTARYVVNWPAEESRLARVGLRPLRQVLGVQSLDLGTGPPGSGTAGRTWPGRVLATGDIRNLLAGLILVMFGVELGLAARRRTAAGQPA